MKKLTKYVLVSAIVITIVGVLVMQNQQASGGQPLVISGINLENTFLPFAVTGTPAPAISCSLTNNVHLIATDGSDYPVNYAHTDIWSPTYSVIIPYNSKQISTEQIKVFLYCNPSPAPYPNYNYYPYLTGGSLTLTFTAHDSTGSNRVLSTQTVPISTTPLKVNGISVQIAQASIPVSTIQNVLSAGPIDYYSLNLVTTTGNLLFKQNPANSVSASYSPYLYTGFSYFIPAAAKASPQCPAGTLLFGTTCQSLSQTLTMPTTSFDKSKSDSISYTVTVNGWANTESYPIVKLSSIGSNGAPSFIKTISFGRAPNSISGYTAKWNGVLSIANDLGGKAGSYELTLQPNAVGSYNRPPISTNFVVFDSTVSQSTPSNPSGAATLQTTGLVQFLYQAAFQNGNIENGIVPNNGIAVSIKPSDIITNTNNGKMISFTVSTIMSITNPSFANMNILSSNIQHTGSITVKGYGVIPLDQTFFTSNAVKVNGRTSSGQAAIYTFDKVSLNPAGLDAKISQLVSSQASTVPIIIEMDTSGSFIMSDNTGKQYTGVITGGVFTYGSNYGNSLTAQATCFLGIGCPTTTPTTQSGSACTATQLAAGFTDQNGLCLAPAGGTTNTCTDSSGNVVACPPAPVPATFCQLNPTDPTCLGSGTTGNNTSGGIIGGGTGGTSGGSTGSGTFGLCQGSSSVTDCLTNTVGQITGSSGGLSNAVGGISTATGLDTTTLFIIGFVIVVVIIIAVSLRKKS